MLTPRSAGHAPALVTLGGLCLAALPAQAQTALPFSGDFTGTSTYFHQITPTSEEDRASYTSSNSSYGVSSGTSDIFLSYDASGNNVSLTPDTTSTFSFLSVSGSMFGTFASDTVTVSGQTQTSKSVLVITGGTGLFLGATGTLNAIGTSPLNSSTGTSHVVGTIVVPAAVPEASTTVSFGLLLAFGLGGVVAARKKAAA